MAGNGRLCSVSVAYRHPCVDGDYLYARLNVSLSGYSGTSVALAPQSGEHAAAVVRLYDVVARNKHTFAPGAPGRVRAIARWNAAESCAALPVLNVATQLPEAAAYCAALPDIAPYTTA